MLSLDFIHYLHYLNLYFHAITDIGEENQL